MRGHSPYPLFVSERRDRSGRASRCLSSLNPCRRHRPGYRPRSPIRSSSPRRRSEVPTGDDEKNEKIARSFACKAVISTSAPGRVRTSDTGFRKPISSGTREVIGRQEETKQRFYQGFSTPEGTRRNRERHGVVVPLWYVRPLALV